MFKRSDNMRTIFEKKAGRRVQTIAEGLQELKKIRLERGFDPKVHRQMKALQEVLPDNPKVLKYFADQKKLTKEIMPKETAQLMQEARKPRTLRDFNADVTDNIYRSPQGLLIGDIGDFSHRGRKAFGDKLTKDRQQGRVVGVKPGGKALDAVNSLLSKWKPLPPS